MLALASIPAIPTDCSNDLQNTASQNGHVSLDSNNTLAGYTKVIAKSKVPYIHLPLR